MNLILRAKQRLLLAMADTRADAEREVTGTGKAILKHLLVLLRYDDPLNLHKHLDDVNTWLDELQDIKLKGNKRLKANDYLEWMYKERDADSVSDLERRFKTLDRTYRLPTKRTVAEVHEALKLIYSTLAEQLARKEFETVTDVYPDF